MPKYFKIIPLTLFLCGSVFADFTIHVYNPWANDTSAARRDSLRMVGNAEVGYYPGSPMLSEGGGWFYYTYSTVLKTDWTDFNLVDWVGPAAWQGYVSYSHTFRIDSLFAQFPPSTNEIWIVVNDTNQPPQVYDVPPHGKVIYLFNPWPDNSCQISIDGRPPMKMQARTDICGWYACYYVGPPDSLYSVIFNDYFHSQTYTATGLVTGMVAGPPIDLRASLSLKDTVYVLPSPFPYGAPIPSATFPGQTGDCGLRKVSGIFRDWKFDANNPTPPNHSFFDQPIGSVSGGKGMVDSTLQPPDYLPQLNAAAIASGIDPPVSSWYQTYTFPNMNGRQNDTCIDLTLKKGDDGRWTFNSDDMGGFFPLDSFNDPNNIQYWDALDSTTPGAKKHNFHFSMEMHLQFIYYQSANLVFDFCGDDDVWIFINDRLAVDLGGLNNRATDTMIVNQRNITNNLGLIDGHTYNMDIFYAERNPIGSNLIIQTTMNLSNSSTLFYNATVLGPGKNQYLILEHVQSLQKTCGFTPLVNQIDTPTVNFFIQGPQFSQPQPLATGGPYYGGITVDVSKSVVTVDSAAIAASGQLAPGQYRITFTSTVDTSRTGYLVFVVAPMAPDHLDVLPDTLAPDPKKDMPVDSILIPMAQPKDTVYAVLRDKLGDYLSNASTETWTSRDTTVVTVAPSPTDKSRCVITKTGTGSTWVVASQPGLKPDSIHVSAIALPNYPIISSAVMLDTNADIIPDMLKITLNDTFHTDQRLDSVVISYQSKSYTVLAAKTLLNGKTLLVPFSGPGMTDAKPSGNVTIFMNVSASEKNYTGAFTDGVGPALIAASVLENDGSDPDVLYLTFSEPVSPSSLIGKQLLLMSAGSSDTVPLTVANYVNTANDSVFTVTLSASGPHPLAGDRVRLAPGSQGGTIADSSANKPNDLNRSVVLGFRPGPTPVTSAYYLDVNADGYIDRAIIGFKRPVQVSDMSTIIVQWNIQPAFQYDTVPVDSIVKINDSLYSMPLHGTAIRPVQIRTSAPMEVDVQYGAFPGVIRSLPLADSAGPVLLDSAKLVYGASPDSAVLTVMFSENVQQQPTGGSFYFQSTGGVRYQLELTPLSTNNNVCTFRVSGVQGGAVPYPANGDVLWINADSLPLVTDVSGCAQRNPLNRRVTLTVVMPPPNWDFPISKNPFAAGMDAGSEIGAMPRAPIIDADRYSLTISIYDVIGNLVLTMPMPPKGNGWTYFWDGRNRYGRLVGSGVYSGLITIYKNNAAIQTKRIRIGVKR